MCTLNGAVSLLEVLHLTGAVVTSPVSSPTCLPCRHRNEIGLFGSIDGYAFDKRM
jgi:hypothetical protein